MDGPQPYDEYQAECDARTLAEAKAIEANGSRFAKARAAAHRKATEMAKVAGAKADTSAEEQLANGYRKV